MENWTFSTIIMVEKRNKIQNILFLLCPYKAPKVAVMLTFKGSHIDCDRKSVTLRDGRGELEG